MSRDPLITFCMAHGLALDRETYIAGAYPQGKPDPWTAEHETELPAIFREPRKWALIKSSGSGWPPGIGASSGHEIAISADSERHAGSRWPAQQGT